LVDDHQPAADARTSAKKPMHVLECHLVGAERKMTECTAPMVMILKV
jgi:hypothetical protein